MKKYLVIIIFLSFFVFFQSTSFYSKLGFRDVNPDFILIGVSLSAFLLGPISGQIIGFMSGFVVDIISGGLLGLTAFTYTVIGYGVGLVGKKVYGNSFTISILILFLVTFIKATVLSLFATLFIKPGYFGYFSQGKVFLEAVMNSLLAPIVLVCIIKAQSKVVG